MGKRHLLHLLLLALMLLTVPLGAKAEDIIMSSTPQTVTVGATPVNLYDDGGKDGKTSISNAKYQVTFLPGVEGQKVQIDFTTVAIFEGSIYSQYLRVYNGKEANAESLIRNVKKGQTALIHSTSSDGALTVVFESTTSYSSDGFEATASLFTPQAMTAKGISVEQASADNVAFGDKSQAILNINVKTENTEPALTAGAFSFTANGTSAQVSSATLYYTALDSTSFATTTKVGEATVDGDNFTITPTQDITLSEGDNCFWLAYDINDKAKDGTSVDAALSSIVLGGKTVTPADGNPKGSRRVKNVVYSHASQGTVEKTIYGKATFQTKAKSEWSDDYEGGTDDRINIFTPGNDGYVCQIDFSSFDLYYSSNSYYGARAKFRIYSGKGTKGALLWELTSAADKDKGPGKIIRSTSDDGALTIVFNPNDSYYSAEGFSATVSEYKQQPMRLDTITVEQATTESASVGVKKQAMLTVNIQTIGGLEPLSLSSMNINLKGSNESINGVSVLKNDSIVASATPTDSPSLTISLDKPITLTEGDNFFTIAYDVKSGLKSGGTIDASLESVNIGGKEEAVAKGDPEGSRSLVNAINMQNGDNGEVVVSSDNPLMFYDDGGKDGNESKTFTGTITFAPAKAGDAIRLKFNSWEVTYNDDMYIYMGGETKDKADYSYSTYPKPVIGSELFSTSKDGKITIKYVADNYSSGGKGFAIEVTSFTPTPLTLSSVSTTAIAPERVRKGQNDIPMQRIDINVDGQTGSLGIDSIAVAISGEGIDKARIYQTDTLSTFSSNKLYAEIVNGKAKGSYAITKSGTYRFWVAADINSDAEVGNTPGVSATAVNDIATTDAAIASTKVDEGMHGTYTVGKNGDYKTIQSAIDALGFGIDGAVTILVEKGEYNELINVPAIEGMGSANTVTLKSKSGNYHDVRIYYDRYSAPGYSSDQAAREYGVVTFDGASYFTMRGIEVTTTDMAFPSVVHLRNQSRHITVDSCYIHAAVSTERSQDITPVYMYSKDVANSNNDYFTLSNSLIEGGYYNAKIGGTGYTSLPKEVGAVIEGNTFRNAGIKSLYINGEDSVQVLNNIITNDVAETNEFCGIDIQAEGGSIEGNSIRLNTKTYGSAIYVRLFDGTAEKPAVIANNEITVNSQDNENGTSAGINLNKAAKHILIAYNTVRVTSPASSAALILNHKSLGDIRVTNNILQNESGGYAYRIYRAATVDSTKFSNNNIYSTGVLAKTGSTEYDFAAWQETKQDSLSHNDSIAFLSNDILEPAEAKSLRSAKPLSDIKRDINGTFRNQVTPTIGAYEYSDDATAPAFANGYPKVTAITDSTATIAINSDKAAMAYILVRKATDEAPIAGEVLADGKTLLVREGKNGTYTADSLVKDGTYVAYVVLKSLRGTVGEMASTSQFTVNGEGGYVQKKLTVSVAEDKATVTSGSSINLKATAANGTEPYTYTWTNSAHQTVEMPISPTACDDYIVTVTDADGNTAADTTRVVVTGDAATATFENLYLEEESYWNGYNRPNKFGSFVSGSYEFANSAYPSSLFWSEFSYANVTATSFDRSEYLTQQFRVVPGGGHNSANYAVAYPYNCTVNVLNREDGDDIKGFYITNTAYVEDAILNGDGMSGTTTDGRTYSETDGFSKGDYLYVDIFGIHADNSKDSVRVYLADYRAEADADRYYLKDWTWVDLSKLGTVKQLQFKMGSSRSNKYGPTTPTYFAIDDFNGEAPAVDGIDNIQSSKPKATSSKAYNLAGQQVGKDYKGVVIVNGKKVIRK